MVMPLPMSVFLLEKASEEAGRTGTAVDRTEQVTPRPLGEQGEGVR